MVSSSNTSDFYSIPVIHDGMVILGVPVGTDTYVKTFCQTSLEEKTQVLEFINKVEAPEAFAVVKKCIASRPVYLARGVHSANIMSSLKTFDDKVDDSIARMINIANLDPTRKILRHLPGEFGGLGIPSISIVSPSAYKASLFTSVSFMRDRFPQIYALFNHDEFDDALQLLEKPPKQRDLCLPVNKQLHKSLLASLPNSSDRAMLISQSHKGTASALMSAVSNFTNKLQLSEFKEALRLRLLMPLFTYSDNPQFDIGCGCPSISIDDHFHCLSCSHFVGHYHRMHDKIRDLLVNLIKKVSPNALVTKEQKITQFRKPEVPLSQSASQQSSGELVCDIMVTSDLEVYFIDLSFTNPACKSAISIGSSVKESVAGNKREREKVSKYNKYLKPEAHGLFIPFIAETTGRLSVAAEKFIQKLCKQDKLDLEVSESIKWERIKFMEEFKIRLVRTNAEVSKLGRAMGHTKGIY